MERLHPPIAPKATKYTHVTQAGDTVYIITPAGLNDDPQAVADFNSMRWFEELEDYKFIDNMFSRPGRPHETQRECCVINAWAWQDWAKKRRQACTDSTMKSQSK